MAGCPARCVEEIQELVRPPNALELPPWTFLRGKNLGYGGPEPRGTEMVALDLSRMNRILEVNDELNYAVVEPGVTFSTSTSATTWGTWST